MILPVIVLYKRTLAESPTFCTLSGQVANQRTVQTVVVYDNSPTPQTIPHLSSVAIEYRHDSSNPGLAAAYNFALGVALQKQIPWLLLFDQDSEVPNDFLSILAGLTSQYSAKDNVAAIVPCVWHQNRMLSPKKVRFGALGRLQAGYRGECNAEVMAINSGAALRTSFLREIAGFNTSYPLDYLDHWLFRTIYAKNKKVVVSAANIRHELSVSDYRKNVSSDRYRSIVSSEARFICSQKSRAEVCFYLFRLLFRAAKQAAFLRNLEVTMVTLRTLAEITRSITAYRRNT